MPPQPLRLPGVASAVGPRIEGDSPPGRPGCRRRDGLRSLERRGRRRVRARRPAALALGDPDPVLRGEPASWVRDDPNAFRPTRADLHGAIADLERPAGDRTWRRRDLFGICYAPARAIDLDGDGWDEIVTGLEAFDRAGRLLWRFEGRSDQYTTLQVGRVMDAPGLQVVIGEYVHAGPTGASTSTGPDGPASRARRSA